MSLNLISNIRTVSETFQREYKANTPKRLMIIDCLLICSLLTVSVQILYAFLVGTFPFNSLLAGVISCFGTFVFSVSLRMQVNPASDKEFKDVAPERAFLDFCLANLVLHLAAVTYLG